MEFYIVDVFAQRPYAGNQLAVFRNAANLSGADMHAIAREINFAESTFIASDSPRKGGYNVRIFTPEGEIPFAGHPTLGTAFIIQQCIIRRRVAQVTLNLNVGQIPVSITYNVDGPEQLTMTQINPAFGAEFDPAEIAEVLGIDAADIDRRYAIREVSTGLPYVVVPLRNLAAVRGVSMDDNRCLEFLTRHAMHKDNAPNNITTGFFVFTTETYERANDLNGRMLCYENDRVVEDAATGSANGCLLAYLLYSNFYRRRSLELHVEQGYEINRPSHIKLDGSRLDNEKYDIRVGGKAHLIATGQWRHSF